MTGLLTRRRFIALSACAAGVGLAARAPQVEWRGRALGAEASITLRGAGAEPALSAALDAIRRVEAAASLFDPASALVRLNAAGRLDAPPAELLALLEAAGRVHALSGGAFDPSVQPVWRLLAESRGAPGPGALAQARALVGWDGVRVDPGAVAFDRPGMALTLNGIAQGFATDRAAAALAAHGFDRALVNVGEYRALGGGWRLGSGFGTLGLAAGEAAATSAPGALLLGQGGHILAPGGAAAEGFETVTVRAPSATLADGLSTALCAAGPGRAAGIIARAPGARMLARLADGREMRLG
ncbi:FAD:protein FMN transferase [Rhodovulum sp. DZ06]|uniref:FAD:protein FMN transferase n=1 Tax=Rhodovulum sp. DZ06 TaxID=3425126 RepID=UPI003D3505EE